MSTPSPVVAVTGATGFVGGRVAQLLADAGAPPRLLVRDAARAPRIAGAEVFACSYDDRAAAEGALAGVDVLLMVSASESADRLHQHLTFVDAVRSAGVGHVVYTSFVGAAPDATFTLARDHAATEAALRSAGVVHTFLRDSLYLDFFEALAGDDGVIRGPAGSGRVAAVARSDVARAAVAVLQQPDAHRDVTYDLTGPEALTLAEVAAVLSAAGGGGVTFHDETVPEAYASRRRWGAPEWQNDAWVSTYTAIAAGELATVSDDVRRVTGRLPLSLQAFLAERQLPGRAG